LTLLGLLLNVLDNLLLLASTPSSPGAMVLQASMQVVSTWSPATCHHPHHVYVGISPGLHTAAALLLSPAVRQCCCCAARRVRTSTDCFLNENKEQTTHGCGARILETDGEHCTPCELDHVICTACQSPLLTAGDAGLITALFQLEP
jgi:hypothetical protein